MSRFILIGHPVAHSISPEIQRAAYRALGMPHEYDLADTPDRGSLLFWLERMRAGEFSGANVTIPWKRDALALSDAASPLATQTGAANVLACESPGLITAHNTDVLALRDELRQWIVPNAAATLIGNGGAALGASVACRELGIESIATTARSWKDDVARSSWPHAASFANLGVTLVPWPEAGAPRAAWNERLAQTALLIQTTSAGMQGADRGEPLSELVDWGALPKNAFVYDVVYNPPVTPFLAAAARSGLRHQGGLGMLVAQAAHAFELWLKVSAPRAQMRDVAERALAQRASG